MDKRNSNLPRIVNALLSRLANPHYRDELIGDLEEEYGYRQSANSEISFWLFRQTILAIGDGQMALLKTTKFVKALSVMTCILVLPSIALFVGWLSNMSMPSEKLWELLLAGDMHVLLLTGEYWSVAWREGGVSHLTPSMFMNIPSILWAALFVVSSQVLFKTKTISVHLFSSVSLGYMLMPYLLGYMFISVFEPAAHKVGPILAFMMLAPFFTLPTFVTVLFRRYPHALGKNQ